LAEGDYIERAETIILMGEPGTGKTHLATALGMAAAKPRPCRALYQYRAAGQ
jgi:DNA replication protein DnaC